MDNHQPEQPAPTPKKTRKPRTTKSSSSAPPPWETESLGQSVEPGIAGNDAGNPPATTPPAESTSEGNNAGKPTTAPQIESAIGEDNAGKVAVQPAAADSLDTGADDGPVARVRDGESKAQCWERIRKEGRAAGMSRRAAYDRATREVDRLFPAPAPVIIEPEPEPIAVEPEPILSKILDKLPPMDEPIEEAATGPTAQAPSVDSGVSGLGDMPPDWPQLPANAQLQVEIAWVSANRLRVRSGSGVDLSRALSPAPSYSALSWLETSILFPSKFADIQTSKAAAQQDDEREHIKREKLAIDEIRSILAEMLEAK